MDTITGIAILLTSLAGIVTSIALLWIKVVRPFMKFCKRAVQLVDAIQDLPEWCASVDEVLTELKPNGGGSVKDTLNEIQALMAKHVEDPRCHADQRGPLNDEVV